MHDLSNPQEDAKKKPTTQDASEGNQNISSVDKSVKPTIGEDDDIHSASAAETEKVEPEKLSELVEKFESGCKLSRGIKYPETVLVVDGK